MTKDEKRIIVDAVKSQPTKNLGEIAAELNISKSTLLRAIKGKVQRTRGRRLNLKLK